jgi:predicted ester cyclase
MRYTYMRYTYISGFVFQIEAQVTEGPGIACHYNAVDTTVVMKKEIPVNGCTAA